jgi:hypothetical protein
MARKHVLANYRSLLFSGVQIKDVKQPLKVRYKGEARHIDPVDEYEYALLCAEMHDTAKIELSGLHPKDGDRRQLFPASPVHESAHDLLQLSWRDRPHFID